MTVESQFNWPDDDEQRRAAVDRWGGVTPSGSDQTGKQSDKFAAAKRDEHPDAAPEQITLPSLRPSAAPDPFGGAVERAPWYEGVSSRRPPRPSSASNSTKLGGRIVSILAGLIAVSVMSGITRPGLDPFSDLSQDAGTFNDVVLLDEQPGSGARPTLDLIAVVLRSDVGLAPSDVVGIMQSGADDGVIIRVANNGSDWCIEAIEGPVLLHVRAEGPVLGGSCAIPAAP